MTPDDRQIHLFKAWPVLAENLPLASLARTPTPVVRASGMDSQARGAHIWIKDEGCSGLEYGGNKVRKLEFLLGRARASKARQVITFGAAGSNHALATAVYARKLGLKATSLLMDQPKCAYVRKNLLYQQALGARILHARSLPGLAARALAETARGLVRTGKLPFVVPPGGSSALGSLGWLEAGLEIARQVEEGFFPLPDRVYVPLGSMSTAGGLCLGLWAAGLDVSVNAVRVAPESFAGRKKLIRLMEKTKKFLRSHDPSFPDIITDRESLRVEEGFYGRQYAQYTEAGMEAVRLVKESTGIVLEGTYTGKTFAALLADARKGTFSGRNLLFINTYNGVDFSDKIKGVDYKSLPRPFHTYFEKPLQPLEANG